MMKRVTVFFLTAISLAATMPVMIFAIEAGFYYKAKSVCDDFGAGHEMKGVYCYYLDEGKWRRRY